VGHPITLELDVHLVELEYLEDVGHAAGRGDTILVVVQQLQQVNNDGLMVLWKLNAEPTDSGLVEPCVNSRVIQIRAQTLIAPYSPS
jgi:hypothetical protein